MVLVLGREKQDVNGDGDCKWISMATANGC